MLPELDPLILVIADVAVVVCRGAVCSPRTDLTTMSSAATRDRGAARNAPLQRRLRLFASSACNRHRSLCNQVVESQRFKQQTFLLDGSLWSTPGRKHAHHQH